MSQPVRILDDQADDDTRAAHSVGIHGGGSHGPIGELRAAMAMLTRLPISGMPVSGAGVRVFALVGALLGLATFPLLLALGPANPTVAAILAVALLAILSGGLHLDGLADTFDALTAVGPDAAERARRDPAVGAAGATALILILALDVASLAGLLADQGAVAAGLACVVAASVSRLVPAVLARVAPSVVATDGLGAWFVSRTGGLDVAIVVATCLLVLLGCALAIGRWELAAGAIIGGIGSVGVGLGLVRLRGGLDGDLFGASVEIAFALTLVMTAGLAGWPVA